MSWLQHLIRPKRRKLLARAEKLHASIIQKARSPELFGEELIPDTLEGRFNAVTLYSALVLSRLERIGAEARPLSDALNAVVFSGVDGGLRETGVGDASIARKVRKLGESFVGIGKAIHEALLLGESTEDALTDVIVRNGLTPESGARTIASRLAKDHLRLSETTDQDVLRGQVLW